MTESDNDFGSPNEVIPAHPRDYTHSYWKNGWRRYPAIDKSPDILCFETGYYGFSLDVANLKVANFKIFVGDEQPSYTNAMKDTERMKDLEELPLNIQVATLDGKAFQATTARPVNENNKGLCHGRLWEAGRIAQHYELVGVVFENVDDPSDRLPCDPSSVYIVVWPQEFAITLSLKLPPSWTASVCLKLGEEWMTEPQCLEYSSSPTNQEVSLKCDCCPSKDDEAPTTLQEDVTFQVHNHSAPCQTFDVTYDDHFSCFVVDIPKPTRKFKINYTDIRNADIFQVDVDDSSSMNKKESIPILFHLNPAANITGLVPMIWMKEEEDGRENSSKYAPSGIPIQTSKNWHYGEMGAYLRAYTLIPANLQQFQFRVYYGFYGPLCSASHANLSLVGWPKYTDYATAGRWEQLAIGCFGETFCFDIELTATTQTITDVRALMVQGKTNKKWQWTNAGWGGDWLAVYGAGGRKLMLGGVKAAYLSQGPCLTEVKYSGYYGSSAAKQVDLDATVYTTRSNDYARTMQSLRYTFNNTVAFTNNQKGQGGCCLYRMGGPCPWEGWYCCKVALGNREGLIEDIEMPTDLQLNAFFVDRRPLTGSGPWWIAFPDSGFGDDKHLGEKGIAWKCLVIRSFEAKIDEEEQPSCTVPHVSLFVREKKPNPCEYYIDAMLTPPPDVDEFQEGDSVSFDVEWVTIPYDAESYYGDDEAFRKHLQENPKSWKTALREAIGNDLSVDCEGGQVTRTYPIIIKTTEPVVTVTIEGGVSALPIRFEGLDSRKYRLCNSNNADCCDKWYEASYNPQNQTYSLTFNLQLDEKPSPTWILQS